MQIERGIELIDDRAACHVLYDDLRFRPGRRMADIASEQRQGVEPRRVDAVEAEAEFRHVLIGGDGEQIDRHNRNRQQHERDEGEHERRGPCPVSRAHVNVRQRGMYMGCKGAGHTRACGKKRRRG